MHRGYEFKHFQGAKSLNESLLEKIFSNSVSITLLVLYSKIIYNYAVMRTQVDRLIKDVDAAHQKLRDK